MPLLSSPPTASEILDDTGLRPEQVNTKYTSASLSEDITQKVDEAMDEVEGRALDATNPEPYPFSDDALKVARPKYNDAQRAALASNYEKRLRLAVKWIAISYLYERSGQLNAKYPEEAARYRSMAEMLLTGKADGTGNGGLLGELGALSDAISTGQPEATGGGPQLLFIPAFDNTPSCDEFGFCGYC